VLGDRLVPWGPAGYGAPIAADPTAGYRLLTPPTSVQVLAAGYPVAIHPEALAPDGPDRARPRPRLRP
jgi:hypothetical protein